MLRGVRPVLQTGKKLLLPSWERVGRPRDNSRWRWLVAGVAGGGAAATYLTARPLMAASGKIDKAAFMSEPISNLDTLEQNPTEMRTKMELMILRVQAEVCRALESIEEGGQFQVDKWTRPQGGGGVTCVIQDGSVFEKAGVTVAVVHGDLHPGTAQHMRDRGKHMGDGKKEFFAAGISSIIHPRSPNVPTLHFNYRYFEVKEEGSGKTYWWFGGGTDLTPTFLVEEDVVHFHKTLKSVCDRYDKGYYPRFKKWCDDYFYIPHRGEHRGVGGIFFDDVDSPSQDRVFQFVTHCAEASMPSYVPIVLRRKDVGYSYADRQWQLLRRGRYAEYNLVCDRGVKFGLNTPGSRLESILMSLPLHAKFQYCHSVAQGSREEAMMNVLKKPRDWV